MVPKGYEILEFNINVDGEKTLSTTVSTSRYPSTGFLRKNVLKTKLSFLCNGLIENKFDCENWIGLSNLKDNF